ncbi:unnamed protein product [Pleuronectes platessa]|uniref:Uncharacterized protein n=1 Tax=Pleuronectes platessa TaxID=8262 RepID=A0A9N7UJJ4_PLEPL|nr:unnamed protein product [Pleuronectes platessa]
MKPLHTDLGVSGSALSLLSSYLNDETWRGSGSEPCPLTTGVPQGSVLGRDSPSHDLTIPFDNSVLAPPRVLGTWAAQVRFQALVQVLVQVLVQALVQALVRALVKALVWVLVKALVKALVQLLPSFMPEEKLSSAQQQPPAPTAEHNVKTVMGKDKSEQDELPRAPAEDGRPALTFRTAQNCHMSVSFRTGGQVRLSFLWENADERELAFQP